ncbi:DUF5763 domain-containing protein [Flavobacteriaceae bacterium F08102]|nr:DUF5763 domain-containing protein [Flavobacteriaceae bacterium F08102]
MIHYLGKNTPNKTFLFALVVFMLWQLNLKAQNIYKTPSGKKYHLSSCRMVENVSKKLIGKSDIQKYHLTPCKICKPKPQNGNRFSSSSTNKAVGTAESVRCKGITAKGSRCLHKTKLANGFCYQHTKQQNRSHSRTSESTTTTLCGARTASGGFCKRKVKGGGHCYQH